MAGGGQDLPNFSVIDEICKGVDEIFATETKLRSRFPKGPAAQGRATAELKTFVEDRKGHDRRYAIDERKVRQELGYVPSRHVGRVFARHSAGTLITSNGGGPSFEKREC